MSRDPHNPPATCERCKTGSLERGYSTKFKPIKEGSDDRLEVDEFYCGDCRIEEDYNDFVAARIVTTGLLTNYAIGVFDAPGKRAMDGKRKIRLVADPKIRDEIAWFKDRLDLKCREFEGGVWFDAGLQAFIKPQKMAGLSCHFKSWHGNPAEPTYDGFEMDVRCLSSAGRFVITFEATHNDGKKFTEQPAPHTSVTFITEEDSRFHRMGVNGLYGKAHDVLALCDYAIHQWGQAHYAQMIAHEDKKIEFGLVPDEKVSIL